MKETQPLVDLLPGAGVTGVRKVVDSGWCFWIVAVALPGGGALVYGPTDGLSDEGHAALPAPRYLLAPRGLPSLPFRLSGTAPGLRIGGTLPLLHLSDKRAYKDWVLNQLRIDRPTVLVPSHGEVVRGPDLSERLTRLVHDRL